MGLGKYSKGLTLLVILHSILLSTQEFSSENLIKLIEKEASALGRAAFGGDVQLTQKIYGSTTLYSRAFNGKDGAPVFRRSGSDAGKVVVVLTKDEDHLPKTQEKRTYVVLRQSFDNPRNYFPLYAYIRDATEGYPVVEFDVWDHRGHYGNEAVVFGWTICHKSSFIPCKNKSATSVEIDPLIELVATETDEPDYPDVEMTSDVAVGFTTSPFATFKAITPAGSTVGANYDLFSDLDDDILQALFIGKTIRAAAIGDAILNAVKPTLKELFKRLAPGMLPQIGGIEKPTSPASANVDVAKAVIQAKEFSLAIAKVTKAFVKEIAIIGLLSDPAYASNKELTLVNGNPIGMRILRGLFNMKQHNSRVPLVNPNPALMMDSDVLFSMYGKGLGPLKTAINIQSSEAAAVTNLFQTNKGLSAIYDEVGVKDLINVVLPALTSSSRPVPHAPVATASTEKGGFLGFLKQSLQESNFDDLMTGFDDFGLPLITREVLSEVLFYDNSIDREDPSLDLDQLEKPYMGTFTNILRRKKRQVSQEIQDKIKNMTEDQKKALLAKLREKVRLAQEAAKAKGIDLESPEGKEIMKGALGSDGVGGLVDGSANDAPAAAETPPAAAAEETTTPAPKAGGYFGLLGNVLGGLGGSLDYVLTLGNKSPTKPGLLGTLLGGVGNSVDKTINLGRRKRDIADQEESKIGVDQIQKESVDGRSFWDGGALSGVLGGLGGGLDYVLTLGNKSPNNPGLLGTLLGGVGNAADSALLNPLLGNVANGVMEGAASGAVAGYVKRKRELTAKEMELLMADDKSETRTIRKKREGEETTPTPVEPNEATHQQGRGLLGGGGNNLLGTLGNLLGGLLGTGSGGGLLGGLLGGGGGEGGAEGGGEGGDNSGGGDGGGGLLGGLLGRKRRSAQAEEPVVIGAEQPQPHGRGMGLLGGLLGGGGAGGQKNNLLGTVGNLVGGLLGAGGGGGGGGGIVGGLLGGGGGGQGGGEDNSGGGEGGDGGGGLLGDLLGRKRRSAQAEEPVVIGAEPQPPPHGRGMGLLGGLLGGGGQKNNLLGTVGNLVGGLLGAGGGGGGGGIVGGLLGGGEGGGEGGDGDGGGGLGGLLGRKRRSAQAEEPVVIGAEHPEPHQHGRGMGLLGGLLGGGGGGGGGLLGGLLGNVLKGAVAGAEAGAPDGDRGGGLLGRKRRSVIQTGSIEDRHRRGLFGLFGGGGSKTKNETKTETKTEGESGGLLSAVGGYSGLGRGLFAGAKGAAGGLVGAKSSDDSVLGDIAADAVTEQVMGTEGNMELGKTVSGKLGKTIDGIIPGGNLGIASGLLGGLGKLADGAVSTVGGEKLTRKVVKGGVKGVLGSLGRRRRSSLEALRTSVKTNVDLFSNLGWLNNDGVELSTSNSDSQHKKAIFIGFGPCKIINQDAYDKIDSMNEESAISFYLMMLRTWCYESKQHEVRELLKKKYLALAPGKYLIVPSELDVLKKSKLTIQETTLLSRAFELSTFSQVIISQLRNIPIEGIEMKAISVNSVSPSVGTMIRLALRFLKQANTLAPQHFVKLSRSMVLTLKSALTTRIQDYNTVSFKSKYAENERQAVFQDVFHLSALIHFYINGLHTVQMGGDPQNTFELFLGANEEEIYKRSLLYCAHES